MKLYILIREIREILQNVQKGEYCTQIVADQEAAVQVVILVKVVVITYTIALKA